MKKKVQNHPHHVLMFRAPISTRNTQIQSKVLRGLPEDKLDKALEDVLAVEATDESREKLVMHNMREAFFYGRHVSYNALEDDEVFSAVYLALMQAVKNYKPNMKKSIRFFGYAKPYIRGVVYKELKTRFRVVKNSKHESIQIFANDNYMTDDEAEGGVRQASIFGSVQPEYDQIDTNERITLVRSAMKRVLSEHERMVVELCYFGRFDFRAIARMLGVTRSAVFNSHLRAMKKVKFLLKRETELFDASGSKTI